MKKTIIIICILVSAGIRLSAQQLIWPFDITRISFFAPEKCAGYEKVEEQFLKIERRRDTVVGSDVTYWFDENGFIEKSYFEGYNDVDTFTATMAFAFIRDGADCLRIEGAEPYPNPNRFTSVCKDGLIDSLFDHLWDQICVFEYSSDGKYTSYTSFPLDQKGRINYVRPTEFYYYDELGRIQKVLSSRERIFFEYVGGMIYYDSYLAESAEHSRTEIQLNEDGLPVNATVYAYMGRKRAATYLFRWQYTLR